MVETFDLERFVRAQTGVYETALSELRNGQKYSHWMWFIFPQVAGLGHSEMARRFAIRSRAEAVAYIAHPVLGPRLIECAHALEPWSERTAVSIFGRPDDLKLRSSLTLFAAVAPPEAPFEALIDQFFGGQADPATLRFLAVANARVRGGDSG